LRSFVLSSWATAPAANESFDCKGLSVTIPAATGMGSVLIRFLYTGQFIGHVGPARGYSTATTPLMM